MNDSITYITELLKLVKNLDSDDTIVTVVVTIIVVTIILLSKTVIHVEQRMNHSLTKNLTNLL